jgi:hypothetical protein
MLSNNQALTLLSPWRQDQLDFFRKEYNSNLDFRRIINKKVEEYKKDPQVFLNGDYSQAELRVVADLSKEDKMITIYNKQAEEESRGVDTSDIKELDFHLHTAADVYGKTIYDITKAERRYAKSITFGLLYGAGAWRIAQETGLTLKEAEKLLAKFWQAYPKIKKWVITVIAEGVEKGYVSTPVGRRRSVPHLQGKKEIVEIYEKGKELKDLKNESGFPLYGAMNSVLSREIRQARNYPVQSYTSDIVTNGVFLFSEECRFKGMTVHLHNIVHDSIGVSTNLSNLVETVKSFKDCMENQIREEFHIGVPLRLDIEAGFSYETKTKVPYLTSMINPEELVTKMYDNFRNLKAETIITAVAKNSLYLFEDEYRKPGSLSKKEEEESGIKNSDFRKMFKDYELRWGTNHVKTMEAIQAEIAKSVNYAFLKEEEEYLEVN